MILKGKKVILRAVEIEDMPFIRSILNDPDVEKNIIGWSLPLSKTDDAKLYADFANTQENIRYMIENFDGEVVGFIGLGNIDMKNGCAGGSGTRIAAQFHSKGYATDARLTLYNYAFNELRLHRIEGTAFDDNLASIRSMEKSGCKVEGVRREAIYKNGKYKNVVTFGCLKDEFMEVYRKYISEQ